MGYRIAADLLVLVQFLFVVFVVTGGFLALRWRRIVWAHLPAAVWGALIEFMGWVCPLTPAEVSLRRLAGEAGYEGGFIEHYIVRILYPAGLTTSIQIALGIGVVVINVIAYTLILRRRHRTAT